MTPRRRGVCRFPSAHIVAQCCTCEAALLAKIPRNLAIDFTRITHANSLAFALLYTVSADEGELTECSLCGRRQTQPRSGFLGAACRQEDIRLSMLEDS